jgi:lipopolysaccharide transport protein LptA
MRQLLPNLNAVLLLLAFALSNARAGETNVTSTVPATNNTATVTVVEEPPAKEQKPTVVTSDRFKVDYAKNIGVFEGNVLAVDPRITVRADKMTVTFGRSAVTVGGTNTVQSLQEIVAEGGVVISQGERKSTSEHAVYTAVDGKVVLTGNPKVVTAEGTVSGKKITFWRNEERMDVESGTQLVIFPDDKTREEPKKPSPPPTVEKPKTESPGNE